MQDTDFIKSVARDFGHEITDDEAHEANIIVMQRCTTKDDYYYELKQYFQN